MPPSGKLDFSFWIAVVGKLWKENGGAFFFILPIFILSFSALSKWFAWNLSKNCALVFEGIISKDFSNNSKFLLVKSSNNSKSAEIRSFVHSNSSTMCQNSPIEYSISLTVGEVRLLEHPNTGKKSNTNVCYIQDFAYDNMCKSLPYGTYELIVKKGAEGQFWGRIENMEQI